MLVALRLSCDRTRVEKSLNKHLGAKAEAFIKSLPSFNSDYQAWYTERLAIIRQLIPDRTGDFISLFEKPKSRREITPDNYTISDALMGLRVSRGETVVADSSAAIPKIEQQIAMLKAANRRFDSSLFDIRELLAADLFDSEIEAAQELSRKRFTRAAGAIGGVVLERHLRKVCTAHKVTIAKKNPSIGDLNDLLKNSDVIEMKDWRFIQRLGDIRNLCDHSKGHEPTREDVDELLAGVSKVMKTIH